MKVPKGKTKEKNQNQWTKVGPKTTGLPTTPETPIQETTEDKTLDTNPFSVLAEDLTDTLGDPILGADITELIDKEELTTTGQSLSLGDPIPGVDIT